MSTDDCSEIGSGPCPCGEGLITVERCMPDHPWARDSQAWYKDMLVCRDCERKYGFFKASYGKPSRLVLRKDLREMETALEAWHKKRRGIESSSEFKELSKKLDIRLECERSAAARYRLLVSVDLAFGISLPKYRKEGYALESGDVRKALKLLGIQSPKLERLEAEADELWEQAHITPRPIKTGINGLEL